MFSIATVGALALACLVNGTAAAQPPAQEQAPVMPPAAIPQGEAAALAQGWVLLAEGKYDEASRASASALGRFPRNVAALSLLVESEIARGGASTALTAYEAWLGARSLEEPGVLRRVARAFLYEWSRQTADAGARNEALLALAEDGDADAQAAIAAGSAGESASATLGDPAAVNDLIARLHSAQGIRMGEIHALGATGSRRAAAALVGVLDDPRPENRAAAAEALGKLEHTEAIPKLKPLLEDPRGFVRIAAAGALFRLGDPSGAPVLEELAVSEHASVRRSAAILMASQPNESWKSLVRGLAADPDPSVRLDAARLLAPHDPAFSKALFDRLLGDPNVAIREEAALALADSPTSGLADLRRLLREGEGRVKVRAARRVLTLTR